MLFYGLWHAPRLQVGSYLYMLLVDLSQFQFCSCCNKAIILEIGESRNILYICMVYTIYRVISWYSTILLYTIYLMTFESPNRDRDRTIMIIENTYQSHIRIRIDKNVIYLEIIFLEYSWYIPGIFLVYTWYMEYTRYIPGIYHEKTFWGFQML